MKNDQDKPSAVDFYWDGLGKVSDFLNASQIVEQFYHSCMASTVSAFQELFKMIIMGSPPFIMLEVMRIYQYGAVKYGDKNYKGLELQRILDAMGRHLIQALSGIEYDIESGYLHIGHVLANILIAAELIN